MLTPLYLGPAHRTLFGVWHSAAGDVPEAAVITVAPPLLQEGIATQRALWALCEQLSAASVAALRFDWYGSGDAGGSAQQMTLDGLAQDAAVAMAWGRARSQRRARALSLRSGAIGMLLAASRAAEPVDLVLWDPVLDGASLCGDWRRMHHAQVVGVGRYPFATPVVGEDEVLGFDLDAAFLSALRGFDAAALSLPAGSRVLVVGWEPDPGVMAWIDQLVGDGIRAAWWPLETGDAPEWDDPEQFEKQVFPRRGVARLASRLGEMDEWE